MKRIRTTVHSLVIGSLLWGAAAQAQIAPGTVVYDFSTVQNTCYPDNWTFFGYPQTDFGQDPGAEDGVGAFQAADWTECDLLGQPQCVWMGSAVGIGPFNHAQCTPGGVSDANLDLSLGTALSVRMKVDTTVGFGGIPGARLQVQLVDNDGTSAVTPRVIVGKPSINRMPVVPEDWTTIVFPFEGLDWANDNDDAAAGTVPGLNLSHIKEIKFIWRRQTGDGVNVFKFDDITLLDTPPQPWADRDVDGDVDLHDYAAFQVCFGAGPLSVACTALDADSDGDVDLGDQVPFADCTQGPGVTSDFYSWCY
jgi:hypothetical protein